MDDHVARCQNGDTPVEDGTELAEKFEQATSVSESEKAMVRNKFRGGKLRVHRNDHAHPPGRTSGRAGERLSGTRWAGPPILRR